MKGLWLPEVGSESLLTGSQRLLEGGVEGGQETVGGGASAQEETVLPGSLKGSGQRADRRLDSAA